MAGTQSAWADDPCLLGIPRSRQTVAIIYPQYSTGSKGFPPTSGQALQKQGRAHSLCQCSARAAQDIWEHHRPAVGSSMRALGSVHSTSEKLNPGLSGSQRPHQPVEGETPLVDNTEATLQMRGWGYWEAEVSLVIGINQTNHSTNQERPCTTIHRIKKELSVCPSQLCPDLVTFPALSQIKPHTPRLVVPFRQFLQVSALQQYSPLNPQAWISRCRGCSAGGMG